MGDCLPDVEVVGVGGGGFDFLATTGGLSKRRSILGESDKVPRDTSDMLGEGRGVGAVTNSFLFTTETVRSSLMLN